LAVLKKRITEGDLDGAFMFNEGLFEVDRISRVGNIKKFNISAMEIKKPELINA